MPSHDHCWVPCCTNRRSTSRKLSFHSFPNDVQRRKQWLIAIRGDEGPYFPGYDQHRCLQLSFLAVGLHFSAFAHVSAPLWSSENRRSAVCFFFQPPKDRMSQPLCNSCCSWGARTEEAPARRVSAASPKFGPLTELDTLGLSVKEKDETNKSLARELSVLKKNNLLKARVLSFSNVMEADPEGKQLKFLTSLD